MSRDGDDPRSRFRCRLWWQALLMIVLSGAIVLPRLGATGFSMSEGHRVVPAWEMLDDARVREPHWRVPRMFGTAYIRKPPGVMWAIAASSAVFGENEFAARLPSALAAIGLVLVVWMMSTRWFGAPWGVYAGTAQALLPVTWPSARSAEIESLHMLTTGLVCLLIVDWFVKRSTTRLAMIGRLVGVFVAVVAMVCVKGPAGLPFVLGTAGGTWLANRVHSQAERQTSRNDTTVLMGVVGVALAVGYALVRAPLGDEPVIGQSVGAFLWEPGKRAAVFLFGLSVLMTMLPASLAFVFPWGPDVTREMHATQPSRQVSITARSLAYSLVGSLIILFIAGVSNPRYGLPACALITPLVGYVSWGVFQRDETGQGGFRSKRPAIARAMFLGSPMLWAVALFIAAAAYVWQVEPHRRASSGREVGIELGRRLPAHAQLWADGVIEARPEVLLYALGEARQQSKQIDVHWYKPAFLPAVRPAGLYMLLRDDDLDHELTRYRDDLGFGMFHEAARWSIHKYTVVLISLDQ